MEAKKNYSQQLMSEIQQGVEEVFQKAGLPNGMPSLAVIKRETAKLGLPDSDAEAIYDSWLTNGFRTARGLKIQSWHAAVRTWWRNHWFPSQRAARRSGPPPAKPKEAWQPPDKRTILDYCKTRKYSYDWGLSIYRLLVARNWKYFGEPVTSDEQWKAICDTHREQR